MTRQTVSICSCKGGVALDAKESAAIAEMLEWAARQVMRPGGPFTLSHSHTRLRRVILVLRGEEPAEETDVRIEGDDR